MPERPVLAKLPMRRKKLRILDIKPNPAPIVMYFRIVCLIST
jgi:hypothetical protein